MMRVRLCEGWQQKHPTPSHPRSDFHWHPGRVGERARAALGEWAGAGPDAALVAIGPRQLLWARSFAAVVAAEQRRYVGWAATLAEPVDEVAPEEWARVVPALLAALRLPAARPFAAGDSPPAERDLVVSAALDAEAPGPELEAMLPPGEDGQALACALDQGGEAAVVDPHAAALPALWGRLLSWLPPTDRVRSRPGTLLRAGRAAGGPTQPAERNLHHYLARAWSCPEAIRAQRPRYGAQAWQLVADLSQSCQRPVRALFSELTRVAEVWDTAADLRAHLLATGTLLADEVQSCDQRAPAPLFAPGIPDAGWQWARLVHYWGRGFLPEAALPRLALLLAQRIVVDHLFHLDAPARTDLPTRYLLRLRFEALLPGPRAAALRGRVGALLPSLFAARGVA
jgi:hypothetical protein